MNQPQPEIDEELLLQQDIVEGRPYSLAEAIGREGGTFLKGESTVPKLVQVITQINTFIDRNLKDPPAALQAILHQWVKGDPRVSQYKETPLVALAEILQTILDNPNLLYELVRQVDIKWGQMYGERPHFQQPGEPPHPDDEYTHESVRQNILDLQTDLQVSMQLELRSLKLSNP
ncbi:MAG: hypothetical protein AAFO76_07455 [Cyanobacteria bacterium J06607_15]